MSLAEDYRTSTFAHVCLGNAHHNRGGWSLPKTSLYFQAHERPMIEGFTSSATTKFMGSWYSQCQRQRVNSKGSRGGHLTFMIPPRNPLGTHATKPGQITPERRYSSSDHGHLLPWRYYPKMLRTHVRTNPTSSPSPRPPAIVILKNLRMITRDTF